jgi:hypothetical protein
MEAGGWMAAKRHKMRKRKSEKQESGNGLNNKVTKTQSEAGGWLQQRLDGVSPHLT